MLGHSPAKLGHSPAKLGAPTKPATRDVRAARATRGTLETGFPRGRQPPWVGDSKRLKTPAARRAAVSAVLGWMSGESVYRVYVAGPEQIDAEGNILTSTMRGMNAVAAALVERVGGSVPIAVDGNRFVMMDERLRGCAIRTVVGGDASEPAISIASMIAKHRRDEWIEAVADRPELALFGDLRAHQGYGTKTHQTAVRAHGWVRGFHRRSFLDSWGVGATPRETLCIAQRNDDSVDSERAGRANPDEC